MLNFPETLEAKHVIIIALALIFILKRAFANRAFVIKYNSLISTFLIVALALFIAFEFWSDQQWIGFIALGFALLAIIKAVLDTMKK
ncbi:MAG: hypothetical protein ISR55_05765 [Bacteroidetes bacterium]|nr:hypothetical protein [Bacteroidota bacterium]MBL6963311.1 hypothetical protein [Bacteroidota bacterium]